MRSLDEVKAHLQQRCGVRWTEDHTRQAKKIQQARIIDVSEEALQLLNGETYFYRYPIYLQYLRARLVKHARQNPGAPFRVCCAGCSTGEEAYSVAFTLLDLAREMGCPLHVIGFDVRVTAIQIARSGRYRDWSLRNRAVNTLTQFLLWDGSAWEVKERYKKVVKFQVHNLLDPIPTDKVNAALICNVLLYMHEAAVKVAYQNVSAILEEQGTLLIAPTDPRPDKPWRLMLETGGWPIFSREIIETPVPRKTITPPVAGTGRKSIVPQTPRFTTPTSIPAHVPEQQSTANSVEDELLWKAWAQGELQQVSEIIRRKLFFEPEHPLWRFLSGVLMWENGWLRKSVGEMEKAETLLKSALPGEIIANLCTVEELRSLIDFWRQNHG